MSTYLNIPGTLEPRICLGCGKPILSDGDEDIKYVAVIIKDVGEEGVLHTDEACVRRFIEECVAEAK